MQMNKFYFVSCETCQVATKQMYMGKLDRNVSEELKVVFEYHRFYCPVCENVKVLHKKDLDEIVACKEE